MFQPTGSHIQAVHILENNSFILWEQTVFGDWDLDLYINADKYILYKIILREANI